MKECIHPKRVLIVIVLATMIAGAIFVFAYPKQMTRNVLDAERMMQSEDLEQAIEWYLIGSAQAKQPLQ